MRLAKEQYEKIYIQILVYSYRYKKKNGYFPSHAEISDGVGYSLCYVYKLINAMVDNKYLRTNHPGSGRAYCFTGKALAVIERELANERI